MALAIRFHDQRTAESNDSLRDETLAGFAHIPKTISPKFFYDRRGSELFEQICEQPEYYPTRTEEMILRRAANDIAQMAGADSNLIELGSGASKKVRLLLEALRPATYLGIDISEDFLLSSTRRLAADYPWLDVRAACADFTRPMSLPEGLDNAHSIAFFPGSSIGNFAPNDAREFLRNLQTLLPNGGGLLIGVDLVKDRQILESAYNDEAGVTAAFNLNVLERIRTELETDIDPQRFVHHSFYNEAQSRIEMHLISTQAQDVQVEGQRFHFDRGESLHTENSYKYTPEGFRTLAQQAGFKPVAMWTDAQCLFSVHYLERA
jgi:dimethylhistidine N-methyltransferase